MHLNEPVVILSAKTQIPDKQHCEKGELLKVTNFYTRLMIFSIPVNQALLFSILCLNLADYKIADCRL